jgi:hypothetical protein
MGAPTVRGVRRPKAGRDAPKRKTDRLQQSKLDAARRVLGTATETETIERALDLVVFGERWQLEPRARVDATGTTWLARWTGSRRGRRCRSSLLIRTCAPLPRDAVLDRIARARQASDWLAFQIRPSLEEMP